MGIIPLGGPPIARRKVYSVKKTNVPRLHKTFSNGIAVNAIVFNRGFRNQKGGTTVNNIFDVLE